MENLLLVGFIFGLRHAVESDHFAAVASLSTQSKGLKNAIKVGVVWGLGHTLTLFIVAGTILMMDATVPANISSALEWVVGVMLVILGVDVIRRAVRSRIHFHTHTHNDGVRHFHAHSHKGEKGPHDAQLHYHSHTKKFPLRAFLVGLIHGLAGSAALVLLTVNSAASKLTGLGYILIFGAGSIIGMGVLSLIIAIPLQKMKSVNAVYHGICFFAGLLTLSVGVLLLKEHSGAVLDFI